MTASPRSLAVVLALFMSGWAGCKEKKPPPEFRVTFTAQSDGKPLGGVRVVAGGTELGVTDPEGELRATLQGEEGSTVSVQAECPEDYRKAEPLRPLKLRRFQGLDPETQERGLQMSISCPPSHRTAAVVVRADGRKDIPILRAGEELARTDAGGVTHLMFEFEPNTSFTLAMDTSDYPDLRPKDPTASFTLGDDDEIFEFDQEFKEKEKKRRRRWRPKPKDPSGPVRLR
jgi:hypothetical protein